MRELRNDTRGVIERANAAGEVILTDYGTDIAVIRPIRSAWSEQVRRVLSATPPARDTGLIAWLDSDDADSTGDLQ